MNNLMKKMLALLASAVLLAVLPLSSASAYLSVSTGGLVNTFNPAMLKSVIDETVSGSNKTSITVRTSDDSVDAYVRVALVANWVNANGEIVAPAVATDVPFTLNDAAWFKSGDYYYHKAIVTPGSSTANLLASNTTLPLTTKDGNFLQVVIVHQSIQAQPASVVTAQWGVNVSNGALSN